MSHEKTRPPLPRRSEPRQDTPRTGEATPETLRAYLDHLAESSRRFDSALTHYHTLLQEQDQAEGNLITLEQQYQNEQRFALLKAKATKLAWATIRYVTSSTIVGAGSGAAAHMLSGDPSFTILASAGGAMVGSALEFGLSHLEETNDYSDKFFELYEPTQAYMQDKKRREQNKDDNPTNREAEIKLLVEQLSALQTDIANLEKEIDDIGSSGQALFKDPRAPLPTADPARSEAEAAVRALAEHLRTAGQRLNELLAQYFEMTVVAESAEHYLAARQQIYDRSKAAVQIRVTARQAWEMLKTAHMTLSAAGILGMAGYIYNAGQPGSNVPMAVLGGAVGSAIGWFQISRLEKKVWHKNIPHGQYEISDQLAVREDYQLATDPALQEAEALLTEAQLHRQQMQAEQAKLSAELEAFMAKYPMK
ncbi:MAG: hypothetical protein WCV88_02735 [Patescibacteria group bacterium]